MALSCAQVILLFILAIVDVGLSAIIATADCNFIRRSYNAELHLFYTYTIEFQDGSENQLKGKSCALVFVLPVSTFKISMILFFWTGTE